MKKILFTIIFLFTTFLFSLCVTGYVFSFNYTTVKGDKVYHTEVRENIVVFNYGQNIKEINYCFTSDNRCTDYSKYEGDISGKILNVKIDYPESKEGTRLCFNIVTSSNNIVSCGEKTHIVDSEKVVITPKYNEIILSGKEKNLEDLFKTKSITGVKSFDCDLVGNDKIKCIAVGNNGLKFEYEQKVYVTNKNVLEGKSVLFVGDSITRADEDLDNYGGWAARIGNANLMNWKNVGVNGASFAKNKKHGWIPDQIIDAKDDDYDYIIMQGGINDSAHGEKYGEVSDSFDVDDFDKKTFAGGLETMFYHVKKEHPDSKLGFIITYAVPNHKKELVKDRDDENELIYAICEKWNVPYLDLYNGVVYEDGEEKSFGELLEVETGKKFHDEDPTNVHLSSIGYDVVSKYIEVWMKTL